MDKTFKLNKSRNDKAELTPVKLPTIKTKADQSAVLES